MIRETGEVQGVVCSGLGEGAVFTQLDWALAEFRAKLGFEPFPGTFNLRLEGPEWAGVRARLAARPGIGIVPPDRFCAAKCFNVVVDGRVQGAVVLPDVPGYPEDKFEIIAPVRVRETLGLRDGDRVNVRVDIGPRAVEGIVFDIDGSVIRGDRPIPGAPEMLAELRRRGVRVVFFTNDNQRPPAHWVETFGRMGIPVEAREILTSSIVAARVTAESFPRRKVLAVGDVGLREAMEAEGLELVGLDRAVAAEVVVVGKDPAFGQETLELVCQAIWNGAEFIATNLDRKVPAAVGFVPASGPIVRAIEYATGKEPLVTGKPSRWAAEMAVRALGIVPDRGAIVGDQLEHDIRMGREAGLFSILVLSGATTAEAAATADESCRPDLVLPDVSHLLEWVDRRATEVRLP